MPIFQCKKCDQVFEKDGLQLVIHEVTIGRVCPECLSGSTKINITIVRPCPGKPYEIGYVGVGQIDTKSKN